MEDINMPRIWHSYLPPPDESAISHQIHNTRTSLPFHMPEFRSQYSSSGPSGPMFNVEQLPVAPNQQQRLLSVPDATPSGSRTQSPHPAGIATPSNIPAAVVVTSATTSSLPDGQSRPDSKPSETEQLLYAAARAVLYNHPALADPSSVSGAAPIGSVGTNGMPRLAIRSPADGRQSPKTESFYSPNASEIYSRAGVISPAATTAAGNQVVREDMTLGSIPPGGLGANHYPFTGGVPRLPPIFQVEKRQVTTTATQAASVSRRRNEATFFCPVPGCGSSFTRRFNLRGHLRSHTEERPYICDHPGCKKGFARQHDCKRHQALHAAKSVNNICQGCKKTFSRTDALNRHLRSENGAECRQKIQQQAKQEPPSDHVLPPTIEAAHA